MLPEAIQRYLRYTSWPILGAMLGLMAVGVLAIHASESADAQMRGFAVKQMVFAGVGLAAFVGATLVPYPKVGQLAYPLFVVTLGLLVLVFFLPAVRGSHRWIDLKVVAVQPSEIAKLSYVILLAWYLRKGDNYRRLSGLGVPFALTFLPMALILKEPDLGTSLLFLPTLYFMLFMAGAKLRHLLGIMAIGTLIVLLPIPQVLPADAPDGQRQQLRNLAYLDVERPDGSVLVFLAAPLVKMEGHQLDRIEGWIRQGDPDVVMNKGYQLHQSKVVLGSGKLSGREGWDVAEIYFRMLPDDHTDFIFSVIGGQWGFLGCAGVLALYAVIFLFGIEIAVETTDAFGRMLAVGVLALLLSQIIINVGMTMGLMPITGMALPLVSYGGSSLVVNCTALGLLVNVGQRRPIHLGRRPFEYGRRRQKALRATTWGEAGARSRTEEPAR